MSCPQCISNSSWWKSAGASPAAKKSRRVGPHLQAGNKRRDADTGAHPYLARALVDEIEAAIKAFDRSPGLAARAYAAGQGHQRHENADRLGPVAELHQSHRVKYQHEISRGQPLVQLDELAVRKKRLIRAGAISTTAA